MITGVIGTLYSSFINFIPLKDRVAGCHSFFMLGADLVQIEYKSMEIIDIVDISKSTDKHFKDN